MMRVLMKFGDDPRVLMNHWIVKGCMFGKESLLMELEALMHTTYLIKFLLT